jgi:hypothetical protein
MPGTVSNPATLQSVINVFGSGGSPINLFAYRRGQTYVPNDIPAYSGVSTTQPALSTFAGLSNPPVYLPDTINQYHSYTGYDGVTFVADAAVIIELSSTGTGRVFYLDNSTIDAVDTLNFTWLLSGSAGDYYAFMDNAVGSPIAGTGSIQQLNITRQWGLYAQVIIPAPKIETLSATSVLKIKTSGGTDLAVSTVTGIGAQAILVEGNPP